MRNNALVFILFIVNIVAQAQNIYFDHIDLKDGLSQISVTALEQDRLGTMWIGTRNGLNRYNGYEIDVFRYQAQDSNSLLGNNIRDLHVDKNDKLWILTSGGLSGFDLKNETLVNYPFAEMNCFYIGKNKIWVGTKKGLFWLDQQKKEYVPVKQVQHVNIDVIFEDDDESLLLGTKDKGLVRYQQKSKSLSTVLNNEVTCIYKDAKQILWIGTRNHGIFTIEKDHILENFTQHSGLAHNQVRDICEDQQGRIWIGTFLGLSILDISTMHFSNHYQSDENPNALSHNSIYTMFRDQEGSIWIGTYFGGVNIYNLKTNIFRYFVADPDQNKSINYRVVGSMLEDDDKNLWIATEGGGVNFYNRNKKSFRYITKGKHLNQLSHNNVKSLCFDNKNRLWIGTLGGLNVLNLSTGQVKKYFKDGSNPNSISSDVISAIIPFEKKLLLGTNQGIVLLDPETEEFTDFLTDETQQKIVGKKILALLLDKNNCLWIGSETQGLSMLDVKSGELVNYRKNKNHPGSISSNCIYQIYQDHMRRIWVATSGGGLNQYMPKDRSFKVYSASKYDLPSDFIYGIAESRYGFLWIATSKGISRFDVEEEKFRAYHYESGFPLSEINERGLYITSDGEVFVGGINGMVSFWEKELQNKSVTHPLYFTALRINNKKIKVGDETGILTKSLAYTDSIRLNHNHTVISFDFTSFNYLKANKSRYQYKMKGFDKEWVDAGYRRTVSYTNLEPGTYTFQVKEKQKDGGEGAITSMVISITPPFYNTWWAYIVYIALITGILAVINRMSISKALLEDNLRKEQVDKERIRELNQSKLHFFTNISHEFRTPLTLVLGQLESLLDDSKSNPKLYNKILVAFKNSHRLKNLADELLEFRKQELGYLKLSINEHDFVHFSKAIFECFEEYADRRSINYKFICHEEYINLWFDSRQLEKVLFNLLSNAFKFTPDNGSVYMLIDQEADKLIVKIIDSGSGIPEEYLEKIFERFCQVDTIGQKKYQYLGSGIGLTLSKVIVEEHGGTMKVESKIEEGSCFEFQLQLGKDHFDESKIIWDSEEFVEITENLAFLLEEKKELEKDDVEHEMNAVTSTILIVEDNAELRAMLKSSFIEDYCVLDAENGQVGLELAIEHQPDLIISDVMMPVLTGTEMCKQLKENLSICHIPIVLLTAKEALEHKLEGFEVGADDYITKPFNIQHLQARCKNLIKSRKQLQQKYKAEPDFEIRKVASNSLDVELLEKALQIVEKHLDNPNFDVNTFAQEMCLGRTNLYGKIKGVTGQTPNEFIMMIRLKKAAKLLVDDINMSVSDVAYTVGFTTPRYFSKCFSDYFKISPSRYAKGERQT